MGMQRLRKFGSQRSLEQIFEANEGRLIHKWMHYFDIYERHFKPFRYQSPRILEIGVSHGGSLDLWQEWFGPGAHITGVDIDPRVKALAKRDIEIRVGDQGDPNFLGKLADNDGPFDIVIDDGSHRPAHQLLTLQKLWPAMNTNGEYLVEDLHTNYRQEYDGGLRRSDTFIEFVKPLIDDLHAFHTRAEDFEPSIWTRTLGGVHLYDSVVVLDRADREVPLHRKTGRPTFDTLYGRDISDILDEDHLALIQQMNRMHRRAIRALKSPVESGRKLIQRFR